jgi:hypothetical protein
MFLFRYFKVYDIEFGILIAQFNLDIGKPQGNLKLNQLNYI